MKIFAPSLLTKRGCFLYDGFIKEGKEVNMFFDNYDDAYEMRIKIGFSSYKIITHYDNRRNCYELVECE